MADWPYNTTAWQRLRSAHLFRFPFCEGCTAVGRKHMLANTVDHRHPISEGGPAFPGHDGLASYCASCHSSKTARGPEAGSAKTHRKVQPRKGCDENGFPFDPAHPWNLEKRMAGK
jgi:5-methylcytosine-specific restriction protein A